jgi:hypothetical protein
MTLTIQKTDVSHDFDFLVGHWHVDNRRLVKRLQGSDEWESFEATLRGAPLLDGAGNTDELIAADGTMIGMAVRFFNPETQQWSDYWVNKRDGILQPPVFGAFVDGVGTFEGRDVFAGTPIRVRYIWSEITPTSVRWEQAFSADDGKTWETNWVMNMTRTGTEKSSIKI